MTARILLHGGLVADGIAATVRRADVLIEGPAIAAVGAIDVSPAECQIIDLAPGSVVCPGFIDAHAHAEGPLLASGRVDGALAQGVTTLVVGQDGESWIGATAATARYLNWYFGPVNGVLEPPRDFSLAAFRDAVAGRLLQNVACSRPRCRPAARTARSPRSPTPGRGRNCSLARSSATPSCATFI